MNEFLIEDEIIIRQENYIELSPVETLIPVAYFLIFILITGLVYHIFPAKKDKSSVVPLGIISGLTFFLLKIYILSSIDGFDLILKKTTIFPFNFLSILGIYFGITLGFIYSSKSRSWHFQKKEKPLFKIKTIFLKFLAFIILGYGLMNFYEGFKIKYDYTKNYPIKTEPIDINNKPVYVGNEPVYVDDEPVYVDDEPVYVDDEPVYVDDEPVYVDDEPVYVDDEPVYVDDEPVYVDDEPVYVDDEPVYVDDEPVYVDDEPIYADDEKDEYIPNRNYNHSPQTQEKNKDLNNKEKKSNKEQIEIFEPILNKVFEYTPTTQENQNVFIPETQKLKELM